MRQRTRTLGWSGAIVFGVLVAACSTPAAVSTPATPVPSATAPVPTAAPPGTAEAVAPNPTPIPPADRQAVLDFAAGHQNISSGWEEFHVGFDDWRQGLASCDPSSVKVALAGFSGEFVALTEAARELPRDRLLRLIADRIAGTPAIRRFSRASTFRGRPRRPFARRWKMTSVTCSGGHHPNLKAW